MLWPDDAAFRRKADWPGSMPFGSLFSPVKNFYKTSIKYIDPPPPPPPSPHQQYLLHHQHESLSLPWTNKNQMITLSTFWFKEKTFKYSLHVNTQPAIPVIIHLQFWQQTPLIDDPTKRSKERYLLGQKHNK